MPRLDPHLERISRRLTTLELRRPDPGEESEDSLADLDANPFGRVTRRFVHTYTRQGLQTVMHEAGLDEKLKAQGITQFEIKISDEDPFRHRLEILLPDHVAPSHASRHVMDMRLHLTSVALPGMTEHADVVVVEWLLMQNPFKPFTKDRPRLPGQKHPGTGLGRVVAQLLVLMCRRIGRDGLLTVPEHFHLAELYAEAGWRTPSPEGERTLDAVLAGTRELSFAARAWAVERGFVFDELGKRVTYTPVERVLPVSDKLESAMSPGGFLWLVRLLDAVPRYRVDLEGLEKSLRDDPVEGMDPDDLLG